MLQDIQSRQDYARSMRSYARSCRFRRINSLDLIPEDPNHENSNSEDNEIEKFEERSLNSLNYQKLALQRQQTQQLTLKNGMHKIMLFGPNLLLTTIVTLMRFILFIPFSIAAPSFWLSALLWIFWKLLRVPVSCIKWIFNDDEQSSSKSSRSNKRTILISCGSTIQALHLARNFHSSGSRVVVFEFEGLFGLARFSAAVDKFYVVPRPSPSNVDSYISALCHIVNKEKPSVYVPVCSTSPAYYDSLAKPHLELLGCASFIPGSQETGILDDVYQFYQKCAAQNIPIPPHKVLSSARDLWHLYDDSTENGSFISNFRNIIMAVGNVGLLERYKYILPNSRRDFKFNHDINEQQQWIVVRDIPGDHYITCTTVKDSKVVANVTCRIDHESKNLIPVVDNSKTSDDAQIQLWLKVFFSKVRFQRSINGHISFRLVKCQATGQFLPLGIRLGVSLPYICYNRSHAQVLCRTLKCVHIRQLTRSTFTNDELNTSQWRWSSIENTSATAALDKREALFAYWDPLPYCAYYHFQLPLKSVKMFLQKRHRSTKNLSTRILPVH